MRSILLIFAHPDDESFFAAGVARKYADAGVRVVLCCATRGERGTAGTPPLTSIARLPSVREQELREAAKVIGVEFSNYCLTKTNSLSRLHLRR